MRDASGWEFDNYVVERQLAEFSGGVAIFTYPYTGDNNRWHITRISLVVTGTGLTQIYGVARVEQRGDIPADLAPIADVWPATPSSPSGYNVAAQNYGAGELWVPEDCRLVVGFFVTGTNPNQQAAATVQHLQLVKPV
jgi:hypothetical protein